MGTHRPEHLSEEAFGRPADVHDDAAGFADPEQLGRRAVVVGREHRPENRHDRVERVIRERERLGVAFDELDREAFGLGTHARSVEQRRNVVDADNVAADPRGRDRPVAGPRRDVEHAPAGLEVGGVDETLRDERHPGPDHGEVAARPGLLLLLLDRREIAVPRPSQCRSCVPPRIDGTEDPCALT